MQLARTHSNERGVLLFVDTDVTIFSDPRPYLAPNADIALLVDIGPDNYHFGQVQRSLKRQSERRDGASLRLSPTQAKAAQARTAALAGAALGHARRFLLTPPCGRFVVNVSRSCVAASCHKALRAELNAQNSGFFLMRYTPRARKLWRNVLAHHIDNPEMLQQPALNAVLRHMAKGSHIEFHGLPERHFLSGWCFYDKRPLLKSGIRPHEVVGIHHNWLKGDANKWARAVSFGAVAFSDADAPGFLERARGSMVTQGAWREALRVLSRPGHPHDAAEALMLCRRAHEMARLAVRSGALDHMPVSWCER